MALDAGTLEVKIVAKTDDATKSVESFQESIEGISETEGNLVTDTKENTGKVGSFFSGLVEKVSGDSGFGGALGKVLGSLSSVGSVGGAAIMAISAAVTAAIAIIKDLEEAANKAAGISDDLITKSQKTGYSTTQLQAMDYAARFVDTDTDTVISAEKKMVSYMQNAADGGEAAQQAFDRLGVSVTNADGSLRDSKEVMAEVVTALGQIDDYTTRMAAAQDVFGLANAADMMPLINAGWDTYLSLQQEAIDKGYVLTQYQIEQLAYLDDLNEKIDAANQSYENQKGAAAAEAVIAEKEAELWAADLKNRTARNLATDGDAEELIDEVNNEVIPAFAKWDEAWQKVYDNAGKKQKKAMDEAKQDFYEGEISAEEFIAKLEEWGITLEATKDKSKDLSSVANELAMGAAYQEITNTQATEMLKVLQAAVNNEEITVEEALTIAQGFVGVGEQIANGTAAGFEEAWGGTAASIVSKNEALLAQIKAAWGIASPSRKMIEMSKNIVLGMAKGMDDNAHVAVKSAQNLSENVYLKGILDTDIISGIDRANASIGIAGTSNNSTDNSRNVNVSVNQNNNYGDKSTLMGQHNSNRKLGSMISGAIASAM